MDKFKFYFFPYLLSLFFVCRAIYWVTYTWNDPDFGPLVGVYFGAINFLFALGVFGLAYLIYYLISPKDNWINKSDSYPNIENVVVVWDTLSNSMKTASFTKAGWVDTNNVKVDFIYWQPVNDFKTVPDKVKKAR